MTASLEGYLSFWLGCHSVLFVGLWKDLPKQFVQLFCQGVVNTLFPEDGVKYSK